MVTHSLTLRVCSLDCSYIAPLYSVTRHPAHLSCDEPRALILGAAELPAQWSSSSTFFPSFLSTTIPGNVPHDTHSYPSVMSSLIDEDYNTYRLKYSPDWGQAGDAVVGQGGFGVVFTHKIRRPGMLRTEVCAVKR